MNRVVVRNMFACLLAALVQVMVCSQFLFAQQPVYSKSGFAPFDRFGQSIAVINDIDNDGISDLAISAPTKGAIRVYSGATGTLKFTLNKSAGMGIGLQQVGDLNADGNADLFACGALGQGEIFSISETATKAIITLDGGNPLVQCSTAAVLSDLNADGFNDIAMGFLGTPDTTPNPFLPVVPGTPGKVIVYSAKEGSILWSLVDKNIGGSVVGIADINADGVPDVAVGSPATAQVFLLSGKTGASLKTLKFDGTKNFGSAIFSLGDVNADKIIDFAVQGEKLNGNVVFLKVFSGATQSELYELLVSPTSRFFVAGDINNDSISDILVDDMAFFSNFFLRGFSGKDGSQILSSSNLGKSHLSGQLIGPAGDLDRDGYNEFYISSPSTEIGAVDFYTFDACQNDSNKYRPGVCGCGIADVDSDGDKVPNCKDSCPSNSLKSSPGVCGCDTADVDSDKNGKVDCSEKCLSGSVSSKTIPGVCGCFQADTDSDADGSLDCKDLCPKDKDKISPGICGCGISDKDSDGDGVVDCKDACPADVTQSALAGGVCPCGWIYSSTNSFGGCFALLSNTAAPVILSAKVKASGIKIVGKIPVDLISKVKGYSVYQEWKLWLGFKIEKTRRATNAQFDNFQIIDLNALSLDGQFSMQIKMKKKLIGSYQISAVLEQGSRSGKKFYGIRGQPSAAIKLIAR